MLAIRMRRVGAKKRPFFRVVVIEQRTRAGRRVRGDPRALLPAHDARRRSRSIASACVLDRQGRPAVRHRADAHRASPAGGRARRSGVAVASHVAQVVETIAKALVDAPDAVKVTENEHARHDAGRVDRGARRDRQSDRPAGTHRRRAQDACRGDGAPGRREGRARNPRRGVAVAAWDDFVLVGHIARPHGHRGQVIVTPRTDFAAERFAPGATIWVLRKGVPTSLVIQDARFHKERPVLTLEGVASMNDALELHGVEIRVPPETQVALPDGRVLPPRPDRVRGRDGGRAGDWRREGGGRRGRRAAPRGRCRREEGRAGPARLVDLRGDRSGRRSGSRSTRPTACSS